MKAQGQEDKYDMVQVQVVETQIDKNDVRRAAAWISLQNNRTSVRSFLKFQFMLTI